MNNISKLHNSCIMRSKERGISLMIKNNTCPKCGCREIGQGKQIAGGYTQVYKLDKMAEYILFQEQFLYNKKENYLLYSINK